MIKVNDFIDYDESSGDLIWAAKANKNTIVGSIAGCKCKRDGYVKLGFKGKLYAAHRVIWEAAKGKIPEGMQIDHINHDRADNRLVNLRLVTHMQNGMNQSISKKNKSGVTGVCWYERAEVGCENFKVQEGYSSWLL